jgi:crossover junction endodeoxyribonuclease RuvC
MGTAATRPVSRVLRVLGIDPAAAGPTGYAVIETDGRECRAVYYGALRAASSPRNGRTGNRLEEIHGLVTRLVEEYCPGAVAVEAPFSALNVRSALQLAEVRGVVLLAAAQQGVPVESYSPREVKASVAGYGHASKEQMQVMVRSQLGLAELPQPFDAADALAVALCHVHALRARLRMAAAIGTPAGTSVEGAPAPRAGRGPAGRGVAERPRGR